MSKSIRFIKRLGKITSFILFFTSFNFFSFYSKLNNRKIMNNRVLSNRMFNKR